MTTPTVTLPDHVLDLTQRPIVAALITVMPDGQPQATPVWFDYDQGQIVVNTARGRQKDRNMTKTAKVTVLVIDPQNPYHWLEVRGHVAEVDEASGRDWINRLSKKYTGNETYQGFRDGETRVTYRIAIDKVNTR